MAPSSSASKSSAAAVRAAPQPLPSSFSSAQAKKAVDALLAHATKVAAERDDTELISRDEHVWLNVNTKHPTTRKRLMPVRIQLPHPPLPPPPATSVCLITKDPQREYKDLLASQGIKFVSRVVGVAKLKGKFKPFEPRRQLMRDHELWLCDDRVVDMMPQLLGKMFFEAKKTPIPVNLKRKDLKTELGKAISSTYYHPSTGTSHAIRISTVGISNSSQTLENLLAAVPTAIAQIQGGWDNVLSIGIKTSTSVLLPVWSSPLEGRFDADANAGAEEDVDMDEKKGKAKGKGKKRGAEDVESGSKKVKSAVQAVEVEEVAPAKKAVKGLEGKEKVVKKKSSTVGSGGAGKRAKEAVLGRK
ncbi:hypothetical protein JCM24511_06696 [Saitozyma sp. JCM 24511]|nr:hypothetical protein JCM24511_06696 [Saitozyma sp. JCM 24511]